jgi:hypothetical protein
MQVRDRFSTRLAALVLLIILGFVLWLRPPARQNPAPQELMYAGPPSDVLPMPRSPTPSPSPFARAADSPAYDSSDGPQVQDLPLPSISQLSPEEQRRAIALFLDERERWLSLRTISAECELVETFFDPATRQFLPANRVTATLKAEILPLQTPVKQNFVQIRLRLESKAYGGVIIQKENICDMKTEPVIWATGSDVQPHITRAAKRGIFGGLPLDDMFMMVRNAHNSFGDSTSRARVLSTKEQFLETSGVPIRKSNAWETTDMFGGESQYLFLPGNYFLKYWFSANTGELRAFDVDPDHSSDGTGKTVRYGSYAYPQDKSAHFPSYFRVEATGEGGRLFRTEVKLSNVQINPAVPAGDFFPRPGETVRP